LQTKKSDPVGGGDEALASRRELPIIQRGLRRREGKKKRLALPRGGEKYIFWEKAEHDNGKEGSVHGPKKREKEGFLTCPKGRSPKKIKKP